MTTPPKLTPDVPCSALTGFHVVRLLAPIVERTGKQVAKGLAQGHTANKSGMPGTGCRLPSARIHFYFSALCHLLWRGPVSMGHPRSEITP